MRAGVGAGAGARDDPPAGEDPADHPARDARACPAAPAAPAGATATAVLTVAVNDSSGAPLADVKVSVLGPVEREGVTTAAGQARLLGIRPGTYRLRFEKEGFYTFEKEVTWRAGTPRPDRRGDIDRRTAAPPPPPPPAAPEPAPKPAFMPDCAARQAVEPGRSRIHRAQPHQNKEPHKESLIGCSGGAQSWLWQVREPWQNRQHESAELMLYVVGGEGTLAMSGRDITLAAGTLAVIPRGTSYGLTRRGRAPAIYILATLSGPPCAQ